MGKNLEFLKDSAIVILLRRGLMRKKVLYFLSSSIKRILIGLTLTCLFVLAQPIDSFTEEQKSLAPLKKGLKEGFFVPCLEARKYAFACESERSCLRAKNKMIALGIEIRHDDSIWGWSYTITDSSFCHPEADRIEENLNLWIDNEYAVNKSVWRKYR